MPPRLPGKSAASGELPFLRQRRSGGKGGFPSLPALPSRAGAGQRAGRQRRRITDLLLQRIDEGMLDETNSLEEVAAWFNLSLRQLRRIVQQELGVSPLELKQTRRLLLAKQLLTETRLPVTEVAFASGFSSLRRFNDVFNKRYRMAPSRLRRGRRRRTAQRAG